MPTNEELLRKSYNAAAGDAQQDTSGGVYQYNKKFTQAQVNGPPAEKKPGGSIPLPGDFTVGGGLHKDAFGRAHQNDKKFAPERFNWHETTPGQESSGNRIPDEWLKPAGNRPSSTDPGTGETTPGTGETIPGTGETAPGTADTAGTTEAAGKTPSSGNKSVFEWYREYLNKLGGYETPSATSQEEMIRKMYEASLAANKSQLESDYNQNLSNLDSEASTIGSTYYEQQRQAQAESDRNRQAFQEYANARGLNSGTGGQAELAQQNQLAANMNNLRQSEAEKRAEIERQRQLLGQQYQSAIQKAQADNDLNLAKALYEEAVRVDESLTSAAKADADRALQMFNILNSTVMSSADSNASAYAELLGISGGNTEQLNEMYNKAKQIVSSGGYYGSSSSGGSSFKQATQDEIEWAEYYINIINKAGGIDNVENYLATNYKSYGIPYQKVSKTTASMAETAKGYSTNKYVIGSEKGKDIAGNLQVGNKYYASDGSVWRKSPNGKIYVTKDGVEMEADIKG